MNKLPKCGTKVEFRTEIGGESQWHQGEFNRFPNHPAPTFFSCDRWYGTACVLEWKLI